MNLHLPEENYQEALQEWMYQLPLDEIPPLIRMTIGRLRDGNHTEEEAKETLIRFRPIIAAWKKNNIMINLLLENSEADGEMPSR